jgi:hypothetical protein
MLLAIASPFTLKGIPGRHHAFPVLRPPPMVGLAQGQLDALRELVMEWT